VNFCNGVSSRARGADIASAVILDLVREADPGFMRPGTNI